MNVAKHVYFKMRKQRKSYRCREHGGSNTWELERRASEFDSTRLATDPGQLVLQGCKRRVQGSNWLNPAQLSRPWGSTRPVPLRHNVAQRPRRGGRAKARGVAHTPTGVSREGRIQLPCEKDLKIIGVEMPESNVEPLQLQGHQHYNYYYYHHDNYHNNREARASSSSKSKERDPRQGCKKRMSAEA